MSRLTCTFCAHRNPEGSGFCNRCGAPLHLAPCAQCEAINNLCDARCYACGAALSREERDPDEAREELAFAGPVESAYGEPDAAVRGSPPAPTPTRAFGGLAWERPAGEPAPETEDRDRAPAPVGGASLPAADAGFEPLVVEGDDAPAYHVRRVAHRERSRWPKRIVLGSALIAIAGAIGWSTLEIPQAWYRKVLARTAAAVMPAPAPPATTPVPAPLLSPTPPTPAASDVTPAAPVPPANGAPANREPANNAPADGAPAKSAPSNSAPASAPAEATGSAPSEAAAPSDGAAPPAENAPAPLANDAPAPRPQRAAATAPGKSSATSEARRVAPTPASRSREQAKRDALATQRLIERDLGIAQRPDAGTPAARP